MSWASLSIRLAHMSLISRKTWLKVAQNIINNPEFKTIYSVVRKNSRTNKLYLAGGKLYRSIIEELYGYPARAECCDYDFVTAETVPVPIVSDKNIMARISNRYGNKKIQSKSHSMKFSFNGVKVDLISLGSLPNIIENDLPLTIESYFTSVPLTMQSMALELSPDGPELIGEIGQWAIIDRKVGVNNQFTLENYCKIQGWRQADFIQRKAKSVRFSS